MLILPNPAFMMDFTQWLTGNNGRASVAVAANIWQDANDFRMDYPTYCYVGNGFENGVQFWQGEEDTDGDGVLDIDEVDRWV